MGERCSDRQAQCSRFSSSTSSSECNGRRQSLFRDGINEREYRLRLIKRLRKLHQLSDGFGFGKALLEVFELRFYFPLPTLFLDRSDIFPLGYR